MTAAPGVLPLSYPSDAVDDQRRNWLNAIAIALACVIFSGLSVYLAYASESDLEADATTHFLNARYALKEPHYLVGVWGRPLCTCLYAITAHIGTVDEGRRMTRLLSLALALACAGLTYAVGKRQGFRWPALVVVLLLAQPLFFLHSFSELTEIPFATVLMVGYLAYQRRQWLLMAACAGLLPLGRPEGFGFICMAALALVCHRRLRWLPVLAIPFAAWNYAGWLFEGTRQAHMAWYQWVVNPDWWRWVAQNWPYSYKSMYGSGPLLSFVVRLPVLTSPAFFPFVVIGIALAIRWLWPHKHKRHLADESPDMESWLLGLTHLERCEILMALIPLSILAVHSYLWWRGLMGSNGELRYLLIVGPFFALLGARGWEWAWATFRWRWPMTVAGVLALAPISVNFVYHLVPFPLYEEGIVSREVARWYNSDRQLKADFPRIMPTPPQVFYFMDVSQTDRGRAMSACVATVTNPTPGALLVWDPVYGPHNSDAAMCVDKDLIERSGWVHYRTFECADKYCDVYLSPKTADGQDTRVRYKGDLFDDVFQLPGRF